MGNKPAMSGDIQIKKDDGYEKVGDIALWKNDSENERAPDFKGNITIGKKEQKFMVSLWDRIVKEKGEEADYEVPEFG